MHDDQRCSFEPSDQCFCLVGWVRITVFEVSLPQSQSYGIGKSPANCNPPPKKKLIFLCRAAKASEPLVWSGFRRFRASSCIALPGQKLRHQLWPVLPFPKGQIFSAPFFLTHNRCQEDDDASLTRAFFHGKGNDFGSQQNRCFGCKVAL